MREERIDKREARREKRYSRPSTVSYRGSDCVAFAAASAADMRSRRSSSRRTARSYGPWSSNPLNDARQCTLPFAQPATKAEFGAKWAGVARVRNGERMEMLLR